MTAPTREARLSSAFVTLADTLVADFDLVDLLQTLVETCTDLLDAQAAGLLLKDARGELHLVVSTTDDATFVELAQLGAAAGPCLECATTGRPVTVADIAATDDRWPVFRDAAVQHGFRSVHATPLRLRDTVIGAMGLFGTAVGALGDEDIAVAQALSDVATIGILSERLTREHETVTAQLQHALDSRIVIEQAKGVLAQSTGVTVDGAFAALRTYARSTHQNIHEIARALVERRLDPSRVAGALGARSEPRDH